MTELHVRWALFTKKPGSREEYAVLAASDDSDFSTPILEAIPGTPATLTRGKAGGPPWVTAYPWGAEVGLLISDASADLDAFQRPILVHRYHAIPYADLHPEGVLYTQLHRAVEDLPTTDRRGTVVVQPPESDEDKLLRWLDPNRFAWSAAVAAKVLAGPVTIVDGDGLAITVRLLVLDAVAMMLPYGYRVSLSVASWVGHGKHGIRLAFGDGRASRGEVVDLRRALPADHVLAPLVEAADVLGVATVLRFLRTDRQHPYQIDDSGPARVATTELAHVTRAVVEARRGNLAPARRLVADEHTPIRIIDNFLTVLAEPLLAAYSDDTDEEWVRRHWDRRQLREAVERQAFTDAGADRMTRLAATREALDELLVNALTTGRGGVALVRAARPYLRDAHRTRELLNRRADLLDGVLREELTAVAEGRDRAETASLLAFVANGPLTQRSVEPLLQLGHDHPAITAALLDSALRTGRPDPVATTGPLWRLLAPRLGRGELLRTVLARVVAGLTPVNVRAMAARDAVLLALNEPVRRNQAVSAKEYLRHLTGVWRDPAFAGQRGDMADRLVASMTGRGRAEDGLDDILKWLEQTAGVNDPDLGRAVADRVKPLLAEPDLSPRSRRRLLKLCAVDDPHARYEMALMELEDATADNDPVRIAQAVVDLWWTPALVDPGKAMANIVAPLGDWASTREPRYLEEVLAHIRARAPMEWWYWRVAMAVCDRHPAFGDRFSASIAERAVELASVAQFNQQLMALALFRSQNRSGGRP